MTTVFGAGALLISGELMGTELLQRNTGGPASPRVDSSVVTYGEDSLIAVKAYYTLMAQYIDVDEEDFVLQSPATLQTLIDTCILRHPSVAQMGGTMFILLDGVPSRSNAALKDGDTVQFIPMVAGG